jgi:probable addiction module antidote protein
MAIKLKKWNSAEHLKTEDDIAQYWEACLEEGGDDPAFITATISTIARARGMSDLARRTGMTREGLYKALSPDGNPEFATVMKVIRALGLYLVGKAIGVKSSPEKAAQAIRRRDAVRGRAKRGPHSTRALAQAGRR